ncbi:MAG: RidA family protein [Planctomycetota bacterium]
MSPIEHVNPQGLHANPAFSQAIKVQGPHQWVFVGGQNAVTAEGEIVGRGDVAAQTTRAIENLKIALEAAGARPEHVIKMTVYLVSGQPLGAAFAASQQAWGQPAQPPTLSVLQVAGLAHPDFLVEIEALAAVPED